MTGRLHKGKVLRIMLVLVTAAVVMALILQETSSPFKAFTEDFRRSLSGGTGGSGGSGGSEKSKTSSKGGPCSIRDCPVDSFSFFIQSGAANVMAAKICLQNKLVLGTVMNNAGHGINMVLMNDKTGEVIKTGTFNMYSGDVKPLIEFLKSIETGHVVLMASFDDPSTKLTAEARQLISELGSSSVKSLGFRDNWVFVGRKGASAQSNFEKHMKSNGATNKYDGWPELIEIQGCIPRNLE
ncbi:protein FAM3C-like [Cebidichthys violaceus]|uniref:protein FAM3C-like n=1 Tax=Cebidichthys violaceus TaxID=271503 RepID=UPI0035CAFD3B